jgi:AmmeMemoRadiSam system protein B
MKLKTKIFFLHFTILISITCCRQGETTPFASTKVRQLVDTVGFAQYPWQVDSLMARIGRNGWKPSESIPWKLVICPHDDYTYTGSLYPEVLQNVSAPNLILIGVAHKAAILGVGDSLVFGTHSHWKGPWGNIKVSNARNELFSVLKGKYAVISDTLQNIEHSLEALIPFLQYFNRKISIIPILVPAMDPERMNECGKALAEAISVTAAKYGWVWGKDYAIVVTTDAVHYGNEDWGGADRAYFGCDSAGNLRALAHEAEIIEKCLRGEITPDKIKLFSRFTLKDENYREYKWTWCGRYSVPVALYTVYYLNSKEPMNGELLGYTTSITTKHIPVDDIKMGRTAIATACHWVGYAALGYRN